MRNAAVACVAALAGAGPAAAQQGADVPPGLYTQTIQSETYLEQGSQTVDVPAGEAAYADEEKLEPLDVIPDFLANDRTLAPGLADNLRGCGMYEGASPAVSDHPLQSDFDRYDREIFQEIERYLADGYPPASVLMHASSMGFAVDRAVYAAIRAQPERATELYTTALELMGFLPGWTCSAGGDRGQYDPVYDVNDLPEQRLVRDVADRYFDQSSRLAQFPDWPNGEFHMLTPASALVELMAREDGGYWYRPGAMRNSEGPGVRDTVLIALYPDTDQIVVDTTAQRIRRWRDQGRERIPVTVFYNREYQRPVSRFADDATLEDIMEAFYEDGIELTPVPLWTAGQHHLKVSGEQLEALFDLPGTGDIPPGRYAALADELAANGFASKPVLVTLLSRGNYRRVAEADRIRVALDRGIESFPVTLFYHRLEREACGAPALCFENLCNALVCAGGDPNVCLDPAAAGEIRESSFNAPLGGGGSGGSGGGGAPAPEPPPPPPSASPS